MTIAVQHTDHASFLKKINSCLFFIMLLMIACFFSWSEDVLITRILKVVGRMSALLASYWVYQKILSRGAIDSLKGKNSFSLLFYVLYLLLGLASFMWSTNVGYSALQWIMTLQTLIFSYFFIKCLYLLNEYFPRHSIRLYHILGNTAFVLTLIFVIGSWVSPDTFFRLTHGGEEARLGGYMMNPNELGMLAGLGVAAFIFDLYRSHRRWWTIAKLLILFYGLYLTGSRSSLIGVFLVIGFHLKQSANIKLKIAVAVIGILITPLAINKIILKNGNADRLEEVMDMTGRLPFWKALLNEGLPREPLLGYGFMRIGYKGHFQSVHTYPGKMTHNTFIQVVMNLGFVGLTIVIFQMLFTFIGISKEKKEKKLLLWSLLIPLFINSFTEFGIFGESNYGILYYQLIIIYSSLKPNSIRTPKEKNYLLKKRPDLYLEKGNIISKK